MLCKRCTFPRFVRCYSSLEGFLSEKELHKLQSEVNSSKATLVLPETRPGGPPVPQGTSGKRALALLTGWASSPLKAVAKHSSPYTKVGIPALCLAPSITHVWSSTLGARLARSLLQSINASLEGPVSLILHSFSSGITAVMPFMAADYESKDQKLMHKLIPTCAVFDSGPANFTYASGMAGAKLMRKQGGYSTATYLASISMGITVNALIGRHKRNELSRVLLSPLLDVPQLYLHTELDTVVPPSWIQEVMEGQRGRGRDAVSYCWKDLEHVRLYLKDPETYEHQIHTLLRKCQLLYDDIYM